MKRRKLFCLLLAAVMLFSLAACGKGEDETKDPNLLTVGEFELHYKGASIMKDREGNDALVLTLDFTNNSEETTDYFWAIYETVMQNDTELETAVVYLNEETLEAVDDSQYQNVAPGATFEVQTAYELIDTAGEVEVTFEEMEGDKNDSITIDLSSVSRESASGGTAQLMPAAAQHSLPAAIRAREPEAGAVCPAAKPVPPAVSSCRTGGTATGTAGGL